MDKLSGFNYEITPRLHDEYNSKNGQKYFAKTINIPLTDIPNGIYFVQIYSNKGTLIKN